MHTHITKQNVAAAIRDDKAHMDYLKRDVKDDQKFHVADKDARQTHDEQHISNLAQDVKHDEKKEGVSRMESPLNVGPDAKKKDYSFGQKLVGTAKNVGDYVSGAYNKSEVLAGIGVTNPHGSKAERKHDLGKSKDAFARAKKRKEEGSAFFRNTSTNSPINNIAYGDRSGKTGYIGEEREDLMKYNPVDDRAGVSRYKRER